MKILENFPFILASFPFYWNFHCCVFCNWNNFVVFEEKGELWNFVDSKHMHEAWEAGNFILLESFHILKIEWNKMKCLDSWDSSNDFDPKTMANSNLFLTFMALIFALYNFFNSISPAFLCVTINFPWKKISFNKKYIRNAMKISVTRHFV